jgi:hypothetical protein
MMLSSALCRARSWWSFAMPNGGGGLVVGAGKFWRDPRELAVFPMCCRTSKAAASLTGREMKPYKLPCC